MSIVARLERRQTMCVVLATDFQRTCPHLVRGQGVVGCQRRIFATARLPDRGNAFCYSPRFSPVCAFGLKMYGITPKTSQKRSEKPPKSVTSAFISLAGSSFHLLSAFSCRFLACSPDVSPGQSRNGGIQKVTARSNLWTLCLLHLARLSP